jgi:subtilase family serine protease
VTDVVSGSCAGYAKPSWQSVFGNPSDGVRDLPDVALFAANGVWGHAYVVCFSDPGNGGTSCSGNPDTWFEAGGTSFASPIMAAIQSLVNQSTGKTWGNPNPTYYSLARSEYGGSGNAGCNSTNGNAVGSSCIFYDVTQGDMDVPCKADSGTLYNCYLPSGTYGVLSTSNSSYLPAYGTHTGWDFATGIGTVNAYNLVTGWSGSSGTPTTTKLALSASSISEGTASVTLTATITAGSGTPTGKVTFYKNGTAISQTGNPATLASGKATLTYTTSGLTVATYAISATYDPTGTFATSGSSPSQLAVQDFTVAANPTAVSVSAPGQSGTSTLTITPGSNGFSQAITFACSGLPTGANCTFTPSSVTPGSSPATTTLSITTTSTASRLHETPFGQGKALFYAMLLPGFLGLVSAGGRKRTLRGMRLFALLCAVGLCSLWLACGGGGTSSNPSTPAGNSTVTVTATSGVLAPTATIALTVQ